MINAYYQLLVNNLTYFNNNDYDDRKMHIIKSLENFKEKLF